MNAGGSVKPMLCGATVSTQIVNLYINSNHETKEAINALMTNGSAQHIKISKVFAL
jgi:hypothetical protein